ncbi:MAG: hypothetical protein OEV80_09740, partial [candidate division Zixibacteria bacterium]|nr:hypothetical protein [candidate division Zixibacteria bacterium]
MTLEDHFSSIDQPGVAGVGSDGHLYHDTGLESELFRLVREDPFASIREMSQELRRRSEFRRVG